MTESSWDRVWTLFHRAAELPPKERRAFLDRSCDDPEVRAEVEELLAAAVAAGSAGDLLERPEGLASMLTEEIGVEASVGDRIGPYRITRRLGEGGMGVVYEAEQEAPLERRVALKLVKLGMDTREVVARFDSERQALALMEHPGIARVFDAGATEDGKPYFAMEYVDGVPIDRYCDEQRLSLDERLRLFVRVCEAVQHAHRKGVIHRDLKPGNVLVTADGEPKIIDFGVAKAVDKALTERTLATGLGRIVGTPEYMSPEQAALAADVDTRADVYALGVVLYELLTGTLPFDLEDKSYTEIQRLLRDENPPRPSTRVSRLGETATAAARRRGTEVAALRRRLRGELDWILMTALAREREERYGTVAELTAEIERYLADEPVLAGPPSRLYRTRKFVRRHAAAVSAAAAILGVIAVAVLLLAIESRRRAEALEREAAERATAEQVSAFLVDLFEAPDPYAQEEGANVTLRQILDRGAERVDEELGGEPLVQGRLMATIGQVYRKLGLVDDAEPLLDRSLAIRRRALGTEHPEVAESIQYLGELAFVRGDYERAEELGRRALGMRRTTLEPHDPALAESLDLIAFSSRELGDYPQAEELHLEALEVKRAGGAGAAARAETLNYLGIVRRRQGDYAGAEEAYRTALGLWRDALGEDHPNVAMVMNNLALLLHVRGDYRDSAAIFEELVPLRVRLLGADHPDIEVTRHNYAKLLADMGRFEESNGLYRQALDQARELRGDEHPRVASLLGDFGDMLRKQGRLEEARHKIEESLAIRRRQFGDEHHTVGGSLRNLARVRAAQGDTAAAARLFTESTAVHRRELGSHHWTGKTLLAHGRFLLQQGELERAEERLSEAVAMLRENLPDGDRRTAVAQSVLGACLTEQGRFEEAERLLLAGYRTLESPVTPETGRARSRLVSLYEAWERPESAARYRET